MWLQEVEQFSMGGGKEVVKLLVGNKVDQPRVIQRDVADDWARSRGMLFMEASAKTKEGISQVFIEVVQKILENPTLLSNTRPAKPGNRATVGSAPQNPNSKGGCC
jgi:Ras-related protein Rab-18